MPQTPSLLSTLRLPRASTLALSFALARGRLMVKLGWAFAAATTFITMGVAAYLGRHDEDPAFSALISLSASAFAYGAGFLVAFGGATQAFREDREQGIRALLASRGVDTREYVTARAAGLVCAVALPTVGGTLVTGLAALASASRVGLVGETARELGISLMFALFFSILVALVALAALGARSRAGGYVVLVALFVAPDIVAPWTAQIVPENWSRLVSLPAVLAAFRDSLAPGNFDGALLLRSVVALLVAFVVLFALVRGELFRLETENAR